MRNLRLPAVLLVLGFLGIVAQTVTEFIAYRIPDYAVVVTLSSTIGFGLAGFAGWRWIVTNWKSETRTNATPARWMAGAAVVLAAGPAAIAWEHYQNHEFLTSHATFGGIDPHYRLIMAGYFVNTLGLLVAAAGFWIASSARREAVELVEVHTAVV
jgi:hypothetical protein